MAEFLNMGGHGFYIWTSYAVVLAVLTYAFIAPVRRHKQLVDEISEHRKPVK
ncbi:MAG: heme exporter protein CcmD [Gammaproteobacteria bacterium]|nr:heme exporter protein CcmD [Gammaproteobacteria bacterium]MCY4228874.1 heme exporter protein CcmD [Gammaproteobacteria bacterium]